MSKKTKSAIAVAAVVLTGCASIVTQPSLTYSNPANPRASEASYPAATPVLMAGTNFAMCPAAEEQKMPMDKSMPMDKPMKH